MHFNLVKKKSRSRSIKNYDEPRTAGNTVTQHDKNEVLLHNHMPAVPTGGEHFKDVDGREPTVIISHKGQW